MREWKKQGAPGQKIMVGMPMYGRSFTLKNTSMFDIGSEVMGGGHAGRYTQEEGFMAYYEVGARSRGAGGVHGVLSLSVFFMIILLSLSSHCTYNQTQTSAGKC